MRKSERDLRRLAERHDLTIEKTRKHWRFRREGVIVAITSSTASNHRTMKNLEAQIRRAAA